MKGYLILSDHSVFEGELIGAAHQEIGEVVFNTSMTGYQEILTDPSYHGQMVVMTYPLIGNYGVQSIVSQSHKIQARGLIVRELCEAHSHWASEFSLNDYLKSENITGLSGIDTRALTKKLRNAGTMVGAIIKDLDQLEAALLQMATYDNSQAVVNSSTKESYDLLPAKAEGLKVAVMDYGIKTGILDSLLERGLELRVFPASTPAEEVLAWHPDGVFLSNGPGDPAVLTDITEQVRQLCHTKPVFGICLGHQLICTAFGGKTEKLKFGHRGGNHPVMDLAQNKVYITSQNHGYVVIPESLRPESFAVTHVNVNDHSIEGVKHRSLPVFSVQYHPEASPGPGESAYLFDQFKQLMWANWTLKDEEVLYA